MSLRGGGDIYGQEGSKQEEAMRNRTYHSSIKGPVHSPADAMATERERAASLRTIILDLSFVYLY